MILTMRDSGRYGRTCYGLQQPSLGSQHSNGLRSLRVDDRTSTQYSIFRYSCDVADLLFVGRDLER